MTVLRFINLFQSCLFQLFSLILYMRRVKYTFNNTRTLSPIYKYLNSQ